MKITLFVLTVFVLSSCSQQWCLRRHPPQTITETKVVEKEVIRDTTIYVPVPGDTKYDSVPVFIPCPDEPMIDLSKYVARAETQFAKAESWLSMTAEGVLQMHIMLEQKEQEIAYTIERAVKERSTHTIVETTEIREVIKDNFWTKLYRAYFWSTLALIAGVLIQKIKPWRFF